MPRDAGIYRCVGTRSYDSYGSTYGSYRPSYGSRPSYGYSRGGYGRTETVYMEVQFDPRDGGYSGAFGGDYYGYRDDYGYRWSQGALTPLPRLAAVTASEDKIVPDNNLDGEKNEKEAL